MSGTVSAPSTSVRRERGRGSAQDGEEPRQALSSILDLVEVQKVPREAHFAAPKRLQRPVMEKEERWAFPSCFSTH